MFEVREGARGHLLFGASDMPLRAFDNQPEFNGLPHDNVLSR